MPPSVPARDRTAPKGKRRYFIEDYCVNGSVCECLRPEVTREQYNLWQREYRANADALNAEFSKRLLISLRMVRAQF